MGSRCLSEAGFALGWRRPYRESATQRVGWQIPEKWTPPPTTATHTSRIEDSEKTGLVDVRWLCEVGAARFIPVFQAISGELAVSILNLNLVQRLRTHKGKRLLPMD